MTNELVNEPIEEDVLGDDRPAILIHLEEHQYVEEQKEVPAFDAAELTAL